MKLATVLTPMTDESLRLAAQCGVSDIVTRYPGPNLNDYRTVQKQVRDYDLQVSVIEGYLPIEKIKFGQDDDGHELTELKAAIRNMGEAQIPILCYNFMVGTDWVRTQLDVPQRGGAKVTAFRLTDAERAIKLSHDSTEDFTAVSNERVGQDRLWQHLGRLLEEIVPVAEAAGVTLTMHPDDPPLPEFDGNGRIMCRVQDFEKLVELVPSPANKICFCQGNFAAMGVDIPATIRRLGPHIKYVHFRDVDGKADAFRETFHDNGPTDMVAAMQAYADIGFEGPIRPDHVPQLFGEDDGEPGYTMKGRLFAYGYMRGLMQAVVPSSTQSTKQPKT